MRTNLSLNAICLSLIFSLSFTAQAAQAAEAEQTAIVGDTVKNSIAAPPSSASSAAPAAFAGPRPLTSAFSIHPFLSVAISGLHVSYEAAFSGGKTAFEVPIYLGYSESVYNNPSFFIGSGFGIRRYLINPGAGTYVSPQIEVLNLHRYEKGTFAESNQLIIMPSLRMGYKWRWNTFVVDIGSGMTYILTLRDGRDEYERRKATQFLTPLGSIAVGIPF